MRRAPRTDANHVDVVDAFRRMGCSVLSLAGLAHGVPDLLCASRHGTFMVEVKDGAKPPSKRKLTPDQVEFHSGWRGNIYIVEKLDDVAAVILRACHDAEQAF